MNNDDFKNLQSGDIIQDERTKEHLIIIQEGPGNHLFAAKLINIFDPRFYSKPDGNAFLALLPKHDARPFTAPEDAPIVPATSGHGNFGETQPIEIQRGPAVVTTYDAERKPTDTFEPKFPADNVK